MLIRRGNSDYLGGAVRDLAVSWKAPNHVLILFAFCFGRLCLRTEVQHDVLFVFLAEGCWVLIVKVMSERLGEQVLALSQVILGELRGSL